MELIDNIEVIGWTSVKYGSNTLVFGQIYMELIGGTSVRYGSNRWNFFKINRWDFCQRSKLTMGLLSIREEIRCTSSNMELIGETSVKCGINRWDFCQM